MSRSGQGVSPNNGQGDLSSPSHHLEIVPPNEIDLQWFMDNLAASPLGVALPIYGGIIDRLNVFMWGHPELRENYLHFLPFIKEFLIILGGTIGVYYLLLKKDNTLKDRKALIEEAAKNKGVVKSLLRGLPVAFAVTELTVQAGYNEIWPNENNISNDWFYLGICAVGALAGILAGYRFPHAHHHKAQSVFRDPKKSNSLWFLDTLLRGFYYATILSSGFLYTFDHYVYTDDVNKSFQRAWEASLLGIPLSFAQAFRKEDPHKKDHPLLIAAILAAFIYKVASRLSTPQDPIFIAIEIALWTVTAIASLITMHSAKSLPTIAEFLRFITPCNTPAIGTRTIDIPATIPEEGENRATRRFVFSSS